MRGQFLTGAALLALVALGFWVLAGLSRLGGLAQAVDWAEKVKGTPAGRDAFNDAVNAYNTGIEKLPLSLLAGLLGMKRREYERDKDGQ